MAQKAERTKIIEVALATAFGYGKDVIGIPETASGGNGFEPVKPKAGRASRPPGTFERIVSGYGIYTAESAAAVVPGEDLIAKIAGISSKTPLVNAKVAAEGAAALGENFEIAPAAKG